MTFAEIEKVIGRPLPEKASAIRAWWSNNASNNVMTKAWLAAGYKTERVDMASRRLVFRRASAASPAKLAGSPQGLVTRIRSALAGTVTIAPGVALTAPIEADWDAGRQ